MKSNRFRELCRRFGIPESQAEEGWRDLKRRYSEPHRHYHNFDHLGKMLTWMDQTSGGSDAMEMAIWFHDCIYEPLGKDNEAQSARRFKEQFGSYLEDETVSEVERLIMATDPRLPRSGKADEDLLVDIDLSILGSPPEEYEIYRVAIRKEYEIVPEKDFQVGRKAVLEALFSDELYVTDFFQPLRHQAQLNLFHELEVITKTLNAGKMITDWVKERPEMYFGERSLKALYLYHMGYDTACQRHGIVDKNWLQIPADFHDWAACRCHFGESTSGWYNMIRSVSDSEEGAFDLFFVLLEEFTNRKARLVARIHQDGSGEATDLVTYTDDPGFFTLEPDEFGRTRFYSDLDFVRIFEGGDIEVLDEEGFRQARGD